MRSSLVLMVASVFMAPTVMACGAEPGERMVEYPLRPSLPAATTTTIPLFQAASTAWHNGSCEQLSKHRPAERQIDDANVVLALELDGLLDGRDHHAIVAGAVLIQNPQIQNIRVRRDAFEGAEGALLIGRTAVARDDAGHMSAVAEIVVEHLLR